MESTATPSIFWPQLTPFQWSWKPCCFPLTIFESVPSDQKILPASSTKSTNFGLSVKLVEGSPFSELGTSTSTSAQAEGIVWISPLEFWLYGWYPSHFYQESSPPPLNPPAHPRNLNFQPRLNAPQPTISSLPCPHHKKPHCWQLHANPPANISWMVFQHILSYPDWFVNFWSPSRKYPFRNSARIMSTLIL